MVVGNRDGNASTANVGSIPAGASWVGALDMSGNVWEWTKSLYRPYPYKAEDGRETNETSGSWRVYRGGSWNNLSTNLRNTDRRWASSADWDSRGGVRCARSIN